MKWLDLVLLQEEGNAIDIAFHPLVLEGEHGGKIELRLHLDAHAGKAVPCAVDGFGIAFRGMQQRL